MTVEKKIAGAIIGSALGDAIGTFTEYCSHASAIELYGTCPRFTLQIPAPDHLTGAKQTQHEYPSPPSEWTDDTDQALLILMSFLASGGKTIDPYDFAKRLRFWVQNGLRCLGRAALGIGKTVGGVVRSEDFECNPFGTSIKFWEAGNRQVASNGAVMRTGIIGALLFRDLDGENGIDRAIRVAIQIAAVTHADPRCLVSCAIVTGLVATTMRNELRTLEDIESVIQRAIEHLKNPSLPTKHGTCAQGLTAISSEQTKELYNYVYAEKLDGNGYTYVTLGAGVWAIRQALGASEGDLDSIFERCITMVVMQGGDSDTNAAVAGTLLGTYLSSERLPVEWVKYLKGVDWLIEKSRNAAYLVDPDGGYSPYNWAKDKDLLIAD
ncbi:ADP-ribosylglycohydrolase [Ceratobasidium sp. AG-Ba]|nr:ADP-ribosylglycohydrolase [Ceratobasidium sp. AG-Ba]